MHRLPRILDGVNMVAPLKTFGDRIKHLREERDLTVRDLASLIGASAGYVSRVEVRGEIPSPEMICRLAEALHASAEALLAAAKTEQLASARDRIEARHADALRLYRRSR